MIKKLLLIIVVLVLVALVTIYFVRNVLVEKAVESGGTYALGAQTELGSARLNLSGGDLALSDLEVRNPEGFNAPNILSIRRGELTVQTGSVLDELVVVDSLVIEGVRLNLEQIDAKGNYREILNHIKQISSESSDSEIDKRLKIGLVALRDIQVSGSLSLMGKDYEKSYTVDNFTLHDVGENTGASVGQVVAKVVQALLTRSVASANGVLPPEFGKSLSELKAEGLKSIESKAKDELDKLGNSLLKSDK